jgi:hypothetical protein
MTGGRVRFRARFVILAISIQQSVIYLLLAAECWRLKAEL